MSILQMKQIMERRHIPHKENPTWHRGRHVVLTGHVC